ncbi:hypothetical protein D3C72_1920130 [compost metagenome]
MMVWTCARAASFSGWRSSSSPTARTPFIGVRSSWLISPMNWLLARAAAAAWSLTSLRARTWSARSRFC